MTFEDPRLDDELHHHIDERVDRLVDQGVDPAEARRRALSAFGDVTAVRRELARIGSPRRSPVGRLLDRIRADVAFSLRQLLRSPGFAAVAVLTLGLGIGASTAIFGLVKAVVLDPLPYHDADRLVLFNEVSPDGLSFSVSDPDYQDYRDRVRSLTHLTAMSQADFATEVEGTPRRVRANMVTGSYFSLLGGRLPLLGRAFNKGESGATSAPLVVLSQEFWSEHYGGDSTVVGRTLVLDDAPFEVVGVMPEGWDVQGETDVWVPLALSYENRDNHDFTVLGRLAPGATREVATSELESVSAALAREHPDTNREWGARVTPLKEAVVGVERVRAGRVLLGAVGLLLLMACASVSNLLLARASMRGREMGLRATLGAGRARLVQQLLTESLVLSLAGGAGGVAAAQGLLPLFRAMSPPGTPRLDAVGVDASVVLFALAVAAGCAVLFGLAPMLHVLRDSLTGAAGERGGTGGAANRVRRALVAAQVALSLTLLFGAGALARSFLRLQEADTGLPLDEAVVVPLMMSGDRYTENGRRVARDEMMLRLGALPGVAAVGETNILPFSGMNTMVGVNAEGRPVSPDEAPFVRWRAVSGDFFGATALASIAGRVFGTADLEADAEPVVIVSAMLARMLFGDPAAAVDERIAMGWDGRNYRRVVGVVPDLEDLSMADAAPATFFFPDPGFMNWQNLIVRFEPASGAPPASVVREAIWSVDPGLPVPSVEPLGRRFGATTAGHGFNLLVMAVFAAVALVLSLLAIYGLVLFAVERRTREIGVRIALGARPDGVVRLVVLQGLRLTAVGLTLGVALSLGLSGFLQGLLFRTGAADPLHLVVPTVVLGGAALVATWSAASRASRVDPREALAAE